MGWAPWAALLATAKTLTRHYFEPLALPGLATGMQKLLSASNSCRQRTQPMPSSRPKLSGCLKLSAPRCDSCCWLAAAAAAADSVPLTGTMASTTPFDLPITSSPSASAACRRALQLLQPACLRARPLQQQLGPIALPERLLTATSRAGQQLPFQHSSTKAPCLPACLTVRFEVCNNLHLRCLPDCPAHHGRSIAAARHGASPLRGPVAFLLVQVVLQACHVARQMTFAS
jgi:hypothetical protein